MQGLHTHPSDEFASKKKKLFIQVAVVFLLTSIALWDAIQIVTSFVNDNRHTLVKVIPADNETFPFLENTRLQLVPRYAGDTLFKELWANNTINQEFDDLYDPKVTIQDIAYANKDYNASEISLDDVVKYASLFDDMFDLDLFSIKCAAERDNSSCSKISKISHLDNVLEHNTSYLDVLKNKFWLNVQPNILRASKGVLDKSLSFFNSIVAYVDVPLSIILTPRQRSFAYNVGPFGDFDWVFINSTLESELFVETAAKSYLVDLAKETYTEIIVSIENIGVFDKRETTICADEPEMIFWLAPSISERKVLVYLKTIAALCNCTPFNFRNEYQLIKTVSNYEQLSSCSASAYERCMSNMQKAMANELFQHCVTKKNLYSILVRKLVPADYRSSVCKFDTGKSGAKTELCSRAKIIFQYKDISTDISYIKYEERFLSSWSQLLAQVGGDIGLYTGISAFGMWQFLMFAYSLYRRRQSERANASLSIGDRSALELNSDKPSRSVVMLVIHRLTGMETVHVEKSDQEINDSTIGEMKMRLNKLEESITTINDYAEITKNDITEIKTQLHQLVQNMEEMFNLIKTSHGTNPKAQASESNSVLISSPSPSQVQTKL